MFVWPLFLDFPVIDRFYYNLSIKGSKAQKQRPHKLLWMLWFDEKSIFKESVCNLTPTNSCWSWGIGFLVFRSVSRVDFVHCGQVPHGVRVPLCKQIKLSSGLGQGVKNAIRQRFRQRTRWFSNKTPFQCFHTQWKTVYYLHSLHQFSVYFNLVLAQWSLSFQYYSLSYYFFLKFYRH